MGCVSSKLLKKNLKQKVLFGSGDSPNHVVSLTSSTYGALKLDQTQTQLVSPSCSSYETNERNEKDQVQKRKEDNGSRAGDFESKVEEDELEVINTWELMEDLEEETIIPRSNQSNWKSIRSPFKRLVNQVSSPKEGSGTKFVGKENRGKQNNTSVGGGGVEITRKQQCFTTPRSRSGQLLRISSNSTNNKVRKAASSIAMEEGQSPRRSNSSSTRRGRRSLGPLFDPELIESLEKELSLENKEQIKEVVMVPSQNVVKTNNYDEMESSHCPPGGENCVVMYTTTLRGIRKTFEECNAVRSAIEAYHIRVIERDISMDSGFKQELRKLMGGSSSSKHQVRVPLVFVKGKLIGGADEVLRLDEEGRLQGLLQGIPKAASLACQACGGIRFVMCMHCNGSCKVLDHNQSYTPLVVRCGECNENGLIQCPLCS